MEQNLKFINIQNESKKSESKRESTPVPGINQIDIPIEVGKPDYLEKSGLRVNKKPKKSVRARFINSNTKSKRNLKKKNQLHLKESKQMATPKIQGYNFYKRNYLIKYFDSPNA